MIFSQKVTTFVLSTLCVAFAQTCPSLTWSDEFSGTALDSSVWTPQVGDGCDLGENLCGWGNNEPQYYLGENAAVSDGTLKITVQRETVEDKEFTSARIRTLGNVEIDLTTEVLIEARIKVPSGGNGIWPAFWLMPSPEVEWPTGGEIDIMEFIGREPFSGHGYIHYGLGDGDKTDLGGPMRLPEPVFEDFHVFAIHKTSNRIAWMIDGHEYQSYTPDDIEPKYFWPFENTYHMILNVAAGGNWPGYPNDSTVFPTTMEVDYVRVYEMADGKTVPLIEGTRLVHQDDAQIEYCVVNGNGGIITWEVPGDASYVASSNTDCILVDFGISSGYVRASVSSTCTTEGFYSVSIPVEVQPYYGVETTILDAITALPFATGSMSIVTLDDEQVVMYTRNSGELYDNIQIDVPLTNTSDFVVGNRKFFFNIKTTTSASCTRIMVQLEDSALVTEDSDTEGRHSRYQCLLEPTREWQRVACEFFDQPDSSVTAVDRVVVLIDPLLSRGDVYYFRNLDIAVAGCTGECEALPTNGASTSNCRVAAHSEEGACADGINNNFEGYDGNDVTDCADPACFMIDAVCGSGSTTTPAPVTAAPSVAPATTAPTASSGVATTMAPTTSSGAATTMAPTTSSGAATTMAPTPVPVPSEPSAVPGESATSSPMTSPAPVPPLFDGPAECELNEACVGLADNCCPTMDNVFLYCCFEEALDSGYKKEFTFVGPNVEGDRATYSTSNSPYIVPATAPDGASPVVAYERGSTEIYDLIYYDTEAIPNALEYASGNKTFYMDVYSTSEECTPVLIQLDSLPMARQNDYPIGRHSRYVAFTTKSNEWERLQFNFFDRPDEALGDDMVNAIVLFFDVGTLNPGKYYFRNMDSAVLGCDSAVSSDCEKSNPKSCPALFSGENCTDSSDNDGDGLIDCQDMECSAAPECLASVSRSYSTATNMLRVEDESSGSATTGSFKGASIALTLLLIVMGNGF